MTNTLSSSDHSELCPFGSSDHSEFIHVHCPDVPKPDAIKAIFSHIVHLSGISNDTIYVIPIQPKHDQSAINLSVVDP